MKTGLLVRGAGLMWSILPMVLFPIICHAGPSAYIGEVSSLGSTALVSLHQGLGEEGLKAFCGVITTSCHHREFVGA
jgi:hypothetical protein